MASKKKQRRTQQRQYKQTEAPVEQAITTEYAKTPRPPLARMDRFLTLVGFGVLIVFVILIAPYFAHKQDRDFEKSAHAFLTALAAPTGAEASSTASEVLSPEVIQQLEKVGAYPARAVGEPFLQGGAKQASVRTAFTQAQDQGLLSVGFLLKQELSLDSRWYPVSFCRPDRQGAQVARDFMAALHKQADGAAYALSAAAIEELNSEVNLAEFTAAAQSWRQNHQGALQSFQSEVPLPQITAQAETLTASWPEQKLSFLLLENPLTCAYAVQFTLQ